MKREQECRISMMEGLSMQAKERVYESLKESCSNNGKITAAELAQKLNLSRQVISHYLTRLMEDGLAVKTSTRPVYWFPVTSEDLEFFGEEQWKCAETGLSRERVEPAAVSVSSVFSSMVGYAGSQRQTVEMCMAAVNYPPDGLPMLLTGESGVGKSFIARLIYEYALEQQTIAAGAPFVVLNCADYANNPELLSAVLLGYKKGSFTGALRELTGTGTGF